MNNDDEIRKYKRQVIRETLLIAFGVSIPLGIVGGLIVRALKSWLGM